jgi:single-strand DNA-binding protein
VANLNRIILVGRLTADPETRSTIGGGPMSKFRLAVDRPQGMNRDSSSQGGSDFFDIIAWQKTAEVCGERLKKGKLALVEGRIQIRSFNDQSGQRRWVTEVVARDVRMLDAAPIGSPSAAIHETHLEDPGPETTEENFLNDADLASDLPF